MMRGLALREARQRSLDSIASASKAMPSKSMPSKAMPKPLDIPATRQLPRPLRMLTQPVLPALVIQGTELPAGVEVQDPDRQQIKKKGRPKKSVLRRGAPRLKSAIERGGTSAKRAKS